jgi:hypothetical protein
MVSMFVWFKEKKMAKLSSKVAKVFW